jgi:hypothetical protein
MAVGLPTTKAGGGAPVAVWRKGSGSKRLAAALVTAVAAGAALGIVMAAGSGSRDPPAAGSRRSPAAPATFAALTHGTPLPVASLPRVVEGFIDRVAPMMGMSAVTASHGVRLVRSSMGPADFAMYAFLGDRGRPCFYVPRYGGICASIPQSLLTGFYWLIGGGGGGQPSYLIALAADEIQQVSLDVAGESIPVSLRENVAFAEYPVTRATSATVTAHYANGDTRSASLALR